MSEPTRLWRLLLFALSDVEDRELRFIFQPSVAGRPSSVPVKVSVVSAPSRRLDSLRAMV